VTAGEHGLEFSALAHQEHAVVEEDDADAVSR
jgi:hypothetical protein